MVQLRNSKSEFEKILVGVPQGLLLGVLLIQIFINDINKCLKFSSSILYTDDTTIFVIGRTAQYMKIKLQSDLNALSDWLCVNQLKLNVKKTKMIYFNKESLFPKIDLIIDNEIIENVMSFKFLGVWLDSNLSFCEHYNHLHEKLLKSSFVIRCLSQFLPLFCLKQLYFAYYESYLLYCLPIWYPLLPKSAQDRLLVLQKGLVRRLCNAPLRQHCMPLFKSLSILRIGDHSTVEGNKLIQRVATAQCPVMIKNLYVAQTNPYNTHTQAPIARMFKSPMANKSFLCKPISTWQQLDISVKSIENVKLFGKKLKQTVLNLY